MTDRNAIANSLGAAIEDHSAVVGVIGLGYVGLPLIDAYISAGFRAIGYDVDKNKTEALNRGESYIAHIEPSRIQTWLDKKSFDATTEMSLSLIHI